GIFFALKFRRLACRSDVLGDSARSRRARIARAWARTARGEGSLMPHDLADCRRLLGLALLVGLLLGVSVAAQGTRLDDVPGHYFNEDQFEIPFQMKPGRNVRQVILWASTDGTNFEVATTSRPDLKKFTYTAKTQGWHYFVVQVEDYDGR